MMAEQNGIKIDEDKAIRLTRRIILMEGANLRDKSKGDSEMKKTIMKLIEEEVKCY